jgi:hypothetical protein
MTAVRSLVLYCLSSCLIQCSRTESFVDVTRRTDGDVFTNPASKCDVCEETARKSCELLNNVSTGGHCVSLENCCKECVCSKERRTYLRHENRCIRNENLTSTLFRDMNQGKCLNLDSQNTHKKIKEWQESYLFCFLLKAKASSDMGVNLRRLKRKFSWASYPRTKVVLPYKANIILRQSNH